MKTVLIGCGAISRNHVHALSCLNPCPLVAVCDTDRAAAEALLSEMGLSLPIYTDYREMLETVRPDAVHICTPHHLHAEMAIEALGRDIHVFMEKPVCINRAQLSRLQKAEQESAALLCICFQNRFINAVQTAKAMVESGELGRIRGARGFVTWDRGGAYYSESPWRGSIDTEGGSVLMNQSIHTLDLLLYFLGKPDEIKGTIANYRNLQNDTEDTAHLYLKFPEERVALFYATNTFCRSRRVEWELICDNAILRAEGEKLYCNDSLIVESQSGTNKGKAVWGKGHEILIEAFYRAIRVSLPSPVPLSSAVDTMETIWTLYENCGRRMPEDR